MGIKNIRWYPSASFPVHSHLIKYLEDGTIHHIEGSMNGPLGKFTSEGKMKGVGSSSFAWRKIPGCAGWRSSY